MPSCAGRLLPIFAHVRLAPRIGIVEQLVLDAFVVGAPDAERNDPAHVLDDQCRHGPRSACNGVSRRTAMLPQPMSKPTPEMLICPS